MLRPSAADFIEVLLNQMLCLSHLFRLEAEIDGQLDSRINPEFRFTVRVLHVHVSAPLLTGEEIEAEPFARRTVGLTKQLSASRGDASAGFEADLRRRTPGLIELNPPGDVFKEFWRQLFALNNPGCDAKPDRRLEIVRRVVLPDVASRALMVLVDHVVEIRRSDFAALPPIEMPAEVQKSPGQFAIVCDTGPFTN